MASKERERWQFEQFCDVIGRSDLKAAQDSEEPDFLFGMPAELGIELADLLSDQAKQGGSEIFKNEKKFDPLQAAIEAELAHRHPGIGIGVNLVRKQGSMGGKRDVSLAVASALAHIEREYALVAVDQLVVIWDSDDDPGDSLAAFVNRLQIYKPSSASATQSLATAPIVAWGLDHVTEPIADLIREKERLRAASYAKKCQRSWLVLVASGTSGASFIDHAFFDTSGTPTTGFERIYLFDQFGKHAILLSGQQAAAATA